MPSPFPGMDPYLESPAHWSDFHPRFILEIAGAINDRLPDHYIARIGEHVMVVNPVLEPPGGSRFVPDVTVVRGAPADPAFGANVAAVIAPPAATLLNIESLDPYTEAYVQVLRLPEQEVITVLELLSPTNKYGEGRGEYMRKRREFRQQGVNVVEIDLLRAGVRLEFFQPLPAGHYYAFVSRGSRPTVTDAYPWTVQAPLPVIPVPLRAPDADVAVCLAEPFTAAYDSGRYWKLIDYTRPPPPPAFGPRDAEWVAQTAAAGARPLTKPS